MAKLSNEQISFLKSQGVSPSQVFDASLIKGKAARDIQMEALEISFYVGGTACQKAGHTLRTKAGHCIQCDTSKIAYQLRNSSSGYVYLAYSKIKKFTKVGFTKSHPQDRADFLRREKYANALDWDIKKWLVLRGMPEEKSSRFTPCWKRTLCRSHTRNTKVKWLNAERFFLVNYRLLSTRLRKQQNHEKKPLSEGLLAIFSAPESFRR